MNANYDDVPEADAICNKDYSKGNIKGWTFCFLAFCPLHGHCYGFHVINGAEGRKDPFHALLKYKPTAPKIAIYDFGCQFSEFGENREPGYFADTEFYTDVFHGANHSCPYAFQCQSIEKKRCYNTSVCEQFNRYFNLIKKTGRSLRLSRFMLYSQFMIHQYNLDRTEYNNKKKRKLIDRVGPQQ